MKKIMAILIAMVMAFSMIAMPASAAVESEIDDAVHGVGNIVTDIKDPVKGVVEGATGIYDSFVEKDIEGVFDNTLIFAENLYTAIHNLVGGIMSVLGEKCPLCEKIHGAAEEDADADEEEEDVPVYETAGTIIGADFANKEMSFDTPYPQNVDAAFVFSVPTKSIAIDGMATANVKTAIVLEEGATTSKIVFSSEKTYNYFHNVEGFKILINNSGETVAIVLKGDVYVGGTLITAANIGNYVDGPFVVSIAY